VKAVVCFLMLCAAPVLAAEVGFGGKLEQGGLLVGTAPANAVVMLDKRKIQVSPDGRFIAGFDRDAPAAATLTITVLGEAPEVHTLAIAKRKWQIERVDGVPQQLVTPDPEMEARIVAEQKFLDRARAKFDGRPWFEGGFIRPVEGRKSGSFGSQRVLNGTPRAPHAGWDIAAPIGTPVRASADGVVSLAKEMLVMTGDTVMLNHGFGLQTMYIHMSKILVADGQQVKQGDIIGEVGMTGRANGPHLHFAASWFNAKLDPETVLAALPAPGANAIAPGTSP
jgi:murein DD-endopeptidase MepM/ murein hydrolase activator NlpD